MAALAEVQHATGGFRNLGEQLLAVRRAAESGGYDIDPRLDEIQRRATIAPAGASEMVPSDGGFLVAGEYAADLLQRMYLTGQILTRCTKFPMLREKLSLHQFDETSRVNGSRLGGIQVYHENEAANIQVITSGVYSQKPTFNRISLSTKKLTGLLYVTDELADDSAAFDTWAKIAFATEMAFMLENDIVNGTGAGQALGILNAPALVTVAKQSGQPTGTIQSLNVIDMVGSLWAAGKSTAIWLYNQETLPYLMSLTVAVGTGGSALNLWHFSEDPKTQPDTLCGIAAYPSEYCNVPGSTGDLILADFSRYIVGIREYRAEVSIHVQFLTDQSAFRVIFRQDGQPIDRSSIVPQFGTVATSPFIALAPRP